VEELQLRFREHFEELLNQESKTADNIDDYLPAQQPEIAELGKDWEYFEFIQALKEAKYHKAPGPDQKPIEVEIFAECEEYLAILWKVVEECLATGVVPNEMKDVIIAILFKKGDKRDTGNYRGLSLIAHLGKVLERMILNRLAPVAETLGWFPEEQNGFRGNRSTADAIFVSRMLSSSCREMGMLFFKCFIDLVKAYDRVNRIVLWRLLKRLGVPDKLLALIIAIHDGAQASVRVNGELLEQFRLESGLKQGSIFAPLFFNIFFGAIIFAIVV
jgi:hypothetical protein